MRVSKNQKDCKFKAHGGSTFLNLALVSRNSKTTILDLFTHFVIQSDGKGQTLILYTDKNSLGIECITMPTLECNSHAHFPSRLRFQKVQELEPAPFTNYFISPNCLSCATGRISPSLQNCGGAVAQRIVGYIPTSVSVWQHVKMPESFLGSVQEID